MFSSVQLLSHVRLFATSWIAACQASLSIANSRSLLKLMSIEDSDAIQPSHPLSWPSPLSPTPPSIRVFSNESTLRVRWPKYWSFSFSISPSNEHPGLIPCVHTTKYFKSSLDSISYLIHCMCHISICKWNINSCQHVTNSNFAFWNFLGLFFWMFTIWGCGTMDTERWLCIHCPHHTHTIVIITILGQIIQIYIHIYVYIYLPNSHAVL